MGNQCCNVHKRDTSKNIIMRNNEFIKNVIVKNSIIEDKIIQLENSKTTKN